MDSELEQSINSNLNGKVKLALASDIPENQGIVVSGSNGNDIALFKCRGEIYALDNACPHMGGPLGEGEIEDCMVTCPWHGWQFDLKSGACQNMPGEDARPVEIEVLDGEIFLK